jgi:hypothetical protein
MQFIVMIDGQQHGPYTPDEVRHHLSTGQLQPQMQARCEGMTDWQPLGKFPEFSILPARPGRQPNRPRRFLYAWLVACAVMLCAVAAWLVETDWRRGLVLYFPFAEPVKNGVVLDQSGKHNDGHAVGVEWVAGGHRGGGAEFGPGESRISVPNNASLNPPRFTLSAWIKTTRRDAIWRRIFDKGIWHEAGGLDGYALTMGGDVNNRSYRGLVFIQVLMGSPNSNRQVTDGEWHHVAGTFDGSTLLVYLDGTAMGQEHVNTPLGANPHDLTIGNLSVPRPDEPDKTGFIGTMDDVMMFNRVLSADEVRQLYELTSSP